MKSSTAPAASPTNRIIIFISREKKVSVSYSEDVMVERIYMLIMTQEKKQECIPVWFVPPASVAVTEGGVSA